MSKDKEKLEDSLFDPETDIEQHYVGYPRRNDLVVATVTDVMRHGCYVTLDEYVNKRGYIHISELSRTWVKNIRVHVREGQRIVAKVLRVDPRKDQIDLSIKRVPEQMKKLKILEAKRNQTATALFQIIYDKVPDDKKKHAEEVRNILIRNFELIYYGLEFAANNEIEDLLELDIEETWAKVMKEVASDNIQPAMVEIKGIMEISIPGGNGVEKLRKVLISGRDKTKEKNTNIEIYTLGSPRYAIEVEAQDYKIAEKVLDNALERIEEEVSNEDGTFSFERE